MCAYVKTYPESSDDGLVLWIRCCAEADGRPYCAVEPIREAQLHRFLAYNLIRALECGHVGRIVNRLLDMPPAEYSERLLLSLLQSENLRHVIDHTEELRGLEIPPHWQTWRMEQGVSFDLS